MPIVRSQITLRLSSAEVARLDAAARRLHLDRAALIRAAALGTADLVLDSAPPLVLAVQPESLLRRLAERVALPAPRSPSPSKRKR
jgi:uncharacterized protein (DUF1778 family)